MQKQLGEWSLDRICRWTLSAPHINVCDQTEVLVIFFSSEPGIAHEKKKDEISTGIGGYAAQEKFESRD